MKFLLMLLGLFLVSTSCFSRNSLVTREKYDCIMAGSSLASLEATLGEPYAVRDLGKNSVEYEYVEHLNMGEELMSENHYFFVIVNNQVISKRMSRESRPAYDLMYREDPNYPTYP